MDARCQEWDANRSEIHRKQTEINLGNKKIFRLALGFDQLQTLFRLVAKGVKSLTTC